jgi:hypothetical protein
MGPEDPPAEYPPKRDPIPEEPREDGHTAYTARLEIRARLGHTGLEFHGDPLDRRALTAIAEELGVDPDTDGDDEWLPPLRAAVMDGVAPQYEHDETDHLSEFSLHDLLRIRDALEEHAE